VSENEEKGVRKNEQKRGVWFKKKENVYDLVVVYETESEKS